eukprot:SAG22_NODE_542_length_9294_cov_156.554649_11_plen_102_part_00
MPRRTRNKLPPGGKWDFFLSHTQRDGEGKMVATTIYYEMANTYGLDFSSFNFAQLDRSSPLFIQASIEGILIQLDDEADHFHYTIRPIPKQTQAVQVSSFS